ncbi:MAG: hypothetical protein ACFB6R_02850 [Alphaproteobacteria bacterium]
MTIFNHVHLARMLGNYAIHPRTQFWYFFFYVVAGLLPGIVYLIVLLTNPTMARVPEAPIVRLYTLMGDLATLVLFIIGLIFSFQVNERGDNRDFVTRYVCLSMPLAIQAFGVFVLVFSMMTLFVVDFVNNIRMADDDRTVAIIDTIPLVTLSAFVTASVYFNVQMILTMRLAATKMPLYPPQDHGPPFAPGEPPRQM